MSLIDSGKELFSSTNLLSGHLRSNRVTQGATKKPPIEIEKIYCHVCNSKQYSWIHGALLIMSCGAGEISTHIMYVGYKLNNSSIVKVVLSSEINI